MELYGVKYKVSGDIINGDTIVAVLGEVGVNVSEIEAHDYHLIVHTDVDSIDGDWGAWILEHNSRHYGCEYIIEKVKEN